MWRWKALSIPDYGPNSTTEPCTTIDYQSNRFTSSSFSLLARTKPTTTVNSIYILYFFFIALLRRRSDSGSDRRASLGKRHANWQTFISRSASIRPTTAQHPLPLFEFTLVLHSPCWFLYNRRCLFGYYSTEQHNKCYRQGGQFYGQGMKTWAGGGDEANCEEIACGVIGSSLYFEALLLLWNSVAGVADLYFSALGAE